VTEYSLSKEAVVCTVCEKKVARYTADKEDDFHGKIQTDIFNKYTRLEGTVASQLDFLVCANGIRLFVQIGRTDTQTEI
jgi:hypothetical protein